MLKNTVVLATTNQGKIKELQEPMQIFGLQIVGLDAFPNLEPVEETGLTFAENSWLKANYVAQTTGLVACADDSGLEVEALGGLPGVRSARYSEPGEFSGALAELSQDERNILKLIASLREIPLLQRAARFCCCMTVVAPGGQSLVSHGYWEGRIISTPRGKNGFGYDPIFFDPELGRTAAELSREEKMAHSHRGKALQQTLAGWQEFWKHLHI